LIETQGKQPGCLRRIYKGLQRLDVQDAGFQQGEETFDKGNQVTSLDEGGDRYLT